MAFHGRKQKDQAQFFRQFRKGALEMRLELVRNGKIFGSRRSRLAPRLRPKRVAQFAAFPGAQTVERETKRDANEPGAEAVAITQAIELAIGAQQGFLGYVFGVGCVAQDPASHAIGERAALGEALLELAPRISLGRFALQLILLVMRDFLQSLLSSR